MGRTYASAAPARDSRRSPVFRLQAMLVALGLIAAATPLAAQAGGDHRESAGFTLDEAVSRVRRETRARVLSADTQRVDGHEEHRVRVLTDQGRVRGYRFDAGDSHFRSDERYREPSRGRRDRGNR